MKSSARILLFDLDGTLTDSRRGIVGCVRYALDQLSVACPADEALTRFIGPPLRGSFATLLGTSDAKLVEEALRLYRIRYETTGLYENQVYDGIPAMLKAVRRPSSVMYVATSKPAVYAERILKHFGLDSHFTKVYGPGLDGRFDDKADLLSHLLRTESIGPDDAVMIGDTAADARAARANGIESVGVLWGYGTESEIADAGAHVLCRKPEDLVAWAMDTRHPVRGVANAP